jgi:hypothetical protein
MAFFRRSLQGSFLDQYTLAFIVLAGSAETNHDG